MITSEGKTIFLTQMATKLVNGGVGIDNTAVLASDTGVFGGGTVIDEMDASNSTNWTEADDAVNPSVLSTAGTFQHGTGCMGVGWNNSSGVASYSRTVSSTDVTNKILYLWFYIADKDALSTGDDAVIVSLGTGASDLDNYEFSYNDLVSGWNSLKMIQGSPTNISASGLTPSALTYVKVLFNETATVSLESARLDYLRYYESDTLGVTEATASLSKTTGDFYIKTTHSVGAANANGLDLVEVCDTDGTTMISRTIIPTVTKGLSTELQVDKYYYWEN